MNEAKKLHPKTKELEVPETPKSQFRADGAP